MSAIGRTRKAITRAAEKAMPASVQRRMRQRRWDQRWARRGSYPWQSAGGGETLERAVEEGWLAPGAEILDVGCGSGEHAAWLAGRGFEVVGFDFSEHAIERARDTHGSVEGVTFLAADATSSGTLPDRSFDAVLDRGCFHMIPPGLQAPYGANLARWTRPRGALLLAVSLAKGLDVAGWRREIDRVLGADFELMETLADPSMGLANDLHGVMFRLTRHP